MKDSNKLGKQDDNRAEQGLDSEQGICTRVEASGISILFDTGRGLAPAGKRSSLHANLLKQSRTRESQDVKGIIISA